MESQNKTKMTYRYLGRTGLKVSSISIGLAVLPDYESFKTVFKAAVDSGINFFDNAEFYSNGEIETLFGKAFKELAFQREDLVISTKVYWGGTEVNRVGLSRKHIIEGINASLKRLQLDYVDIFFAHRPDYETPLEETCRAFDYVIRQGKALYWGTSEWPADMIADAIGICKRLGLYEPVVEQPEYNLFIRQKLEKEYVKLFDDYGYGTTIWSPLAAGILTGRYLTEIPSDSRATGQYKFMVDKYLSEGVIEETRAKVRKIEEIGKEIGASIAQVALAWTLKNKDVSTAIIGASKLSQFEDTIKALDFVDKLTLEHEKKIEEVFKTKPEPLPNPRTWGVQEGRREKSLI